MSTQNNLPEYIAETIDTLRSDNIAELDFDLLVQRLIEIKDAVDRSRQVDSDLALLRRDYTQRIAGMTKAVAVASRRRDDFRQSLDFIESLPSLSTEELITTYRRASASFRAAFPASFGLLRNDGGARRSRNNYQTCAEGNSSRSSG